MNKYTGESSGFAKDIPGRDDLSEALDISIAMNDFMAEAQDECAPVVLPDCDDSALVNLARSGDYPAFEELVKRYRNDVFGLAYHYVRHREDAWDISQEVFIKAHRAISSFRGDASIKTWLLRITANRCKDFFKKRRLKTVSLDAPEYLNQHEGTIAGPEKALSSSEIGAHIHEALDGLSEKHRMAFVLRELEGMSYDRMSQVMGCSLGTVMSRLHNARKKLQHSLTAMGVMEDR
ncbi:MAG: sigma-70 family RNA polymerase sigma factor [Candidatus Hydrogenedentota bacterium]